MALTTERLAQISSRDSDEVLTLRKPQRSSHGIFVYTEVDSRVVPNYCSVCDSPYYNIVDLKPLSLVSICLRITKCQHSRDVKGYVASVT